MPNDSDHRHRDSRNQWTTINPAGKVDSELIDHEARIAALEAKAHTHDPEPPPDPEPTPGPGPIPPGTIGGDPSRRGPQEIVYETPDSSVMGTALADMVAARDRAGVSGVIFIPPGSYPTIPLPLPGQLWQLDPNAVIRERIDPKARGVRFEGGEMRGGAWLSVGSDAHGIEFRNMRIRGRGITNESRDGLVVVHNDMREIADDYVELFYDSGPGHRDVQGLTIEDNLTVRTTYSVNGVSMFSGADGGGAHKLFDPILRNNGADNGFDKGQGPGGIGAFGLFEIWGTVRMINEFNDLQGGGFLNSNVRAIDPVVRWNRGLIDVKHAWAFWESGGTGTAGGRIYENEIIGTPQRNGVLIATATPNPVRAVEVDHNRYRSVRLTSDPAAPGYNIHDNVPI